MSRNLLIEPVKASVTADEVDIQCCESDVESEYDKNFDVAFKLPLCERLPHCRHFLKSYSSTSVSCKTLQKFETLEESLTDIHTDIHTWLYRNESSI